MTAKDILALLAAKHEGDVFIPECKDGPSWGTQDYRIDAWAMKKSWAKPMTWGYEIKVDRSDFVNDDKWPQYLAMCQSFSFICPFGLIDVKEVPEGCGLLYVARTGTRLYTKVKAPRRAVELPESLWKYIVMCRAKIVRGTAVSTVREDKAMYWRQWLAKKEENRELGHRVSRSIQEIVDKRIRAVETKNRLLEHENELLSQVKEWMELNDIPLSYSWKRKIELLDHSLLPTDEVARLITSVDAISRWLVKASEVVNGSQEEKEQLDGE